MDYPSQSLQQRYKQYLATMRGTTPNLPLSVAESSPHVSKLITLQFTMHYLASFSSRVHQVETADITSGVLG